jgi:hypothetical protein
LGLFTRRFRYRYSNSLKSIYDTPEWFTCGFGYEPIFEQWELINKLASSKKLADNLGFKTYLLKFLRIKIKFNEKKLMLKMGDPLTAIENGQYSNAAKLIAGTTVQSLHDLWSSGGQILCNVTVLLHLLKMLN